MRKPRAEKCPGRLLAFAGLSVLVSGCAGGPLVPPEAIPGASPAPGSFAPQEMAPQRQPVALPPATRSPVTSAPLLAPAQATYAPKPSAVHRGPHHAPPRQHGPQRAEAFPAATAAPARTPPPAPRQETATIRFTPVIGAPVSAIEPLSSQLEESARRNGIVIRNTANKPVDGILRGYFSAANSAGRTTVVYVWDVLDDKGNRLYRINGKESVPAAATSDVWASVPDATMKEIARKTIQAYRTWHAGHG